MTPVQTWTVLVLLGILALLAVLLLILPSRAEAKEEAVPASGGPGSIVTVRKVGGVTSVVIRDGASDHWEGDGGVSLPLLPPEVTARLQPELYAEYTSPDTSAIRKYEIIDELYSMGFTLPYIKDLNDLYKREVQSALSPGGPAAGTPRKRAPVDLSHMAGPDMGDEFHTDNT